MYVCMYIYMHQMFAQSNLERLCMLKSATSTIFCRLNIRGVEESIEESCASFENMLNVCMYVLYELKYLYDKLSCDVGNDDFDQVNSTRKDQPFHASCSCCC